MRSKYSLFGIVTLAFIILDQLTKLWVVRNITYRTEEIVLIKGFLSFVHAQNTGAAFGVLQDSPNRMAYFALFTVVALGAMLHMLWTLPEDDRFQTTAVGLIVAGAVGNAIDRTLKQSVTDFIRVYIEDPPIRAWLVEKFGTNEWPSFNVADSCICVGLGMFIVFWIFVQKDEPNAQPEPPSQPLTE